MPLAPEYKAMLDQLAAGDPAPSIRELPIDEGRALYRAMRPVNEDIKVSRIRNESVPGPNGPISVRIYQPGITTGVLIFFHGGGWVIGDLDTSDAVCREISTIGELNVVSVDYRLAPEHRFPGAVEDCFAVTKWAHENMGTLDGNGKIGVAGESAGGNLSAVVSRLVRDQCDFDLTYQCLLYPVTDSDLTRKSYQENGEGFMLDTSVMRWFWDTYCPDNQQRQNDRATPINSTNLTDLPEALTVVAEFESHKDEGIAYAQKLLEAGNDSEILMCEGMLHDFCGMATSFDSARAYFLHIISKLQARLGN